MTELTKDPVKTETLSDLELVQDYLAANKVVAKLTTDTLGNLLAVDTDDVALIAYLKTTISMTEVVK
jgi:hypothetical protein